MGGKPLITRADDPYRGLKRTFYAALIISLLIHPLIIALIAMRFDLRHPDLTQTARKEPKTETVTISSSTHVAPKAVAMAQPAPHHVRHRAVKRPKAVAARPQPKHEVANDRPKVLEKPRVVPKYVPPIPQERELAKIAATGTPVPLPAPTVERTPKPVKPPKVTPPPEEEQEKSVAYNEKSSTTRAVTSRPSRVSAETVAQIQAELNRDTRSQNNSINAALSNVHEQVVASAPKHYNINFSSVSGSLRGGEGICDPIKSWTDDGWDYYYAMCNVVEADGSMNRKPMPWPVRWRPKDDPYSGLVDVPQGPMPLPPPGWKPDPSRPMDPDFLIYLRQRGYAI